jgi:hypothetical protein
MSEQKPPVHPVQPIATPPVKPAPLPVPPVPPAGTKPVDPNKPTQLPADKERLDREKKEKEEGLKRIEALLKAAGGKEENIPKGHEYWDLVKKHKSE